MREACGGWPKASPKDRSRKAESKARRPQGEAFGGTPKNEIQHFM